MTQSSRRESPPRGRRRMATSQSPTDTATPPYMQRAPKPIFMSEDGNDTGYGRSPKSASPSLSGSRTVQTQSSRAKDASPHSNKAPRNPSRNRRDQAGSPSCMKPAMEKGVVPQKSSSSPKYVTLEGVMVSRNSSRTPSRRTHVTLEGVMTATRSSSWHGSRSPSRRSLQQSGAAAARCSSRSPSRRGQLITKDSPSSPKSPERSPSQNRLTPKTARTDFQPAFQELTASSFLKLEAHKKRLVRSRSSDIRSPVQSSFEQRASAPGVGFSMWTQKQRGDLDEQTYRSAKVPWYDWGLSFDRSSRCRRAAACCWSRDHSFRTQPEQWWLDDVISKEARVDGRLVEWAWRPVQSAWTRSQARSEHDGTFQSLGTESRSYPRSSSPVPRPIPLEVVSPFTVAHPEWGVNGYTIGRSKRPIREPTPRSSRSHSPVSRSL